VQLDVGAGHACAVFDDGRLKCWGSNNNGQLGLGDQDDRGDAPGEMGDQLSAVDLGKGRRVVQVSAGDQRTCAVLDDGTVKCWGYQPGGQSIGDEPGEMGDSLPALALPSKVKRIQRGMTHVCAILVDDTVRCWGSASWGQLGSGATTAQTPSAQLPPVDLGSGRTVKDLVLGTAHSCAILDDNTLKCWGFNDDGELGLGDTNIRGDAPGQMGPALPHVDLGAGRTAIGVAATRAPIIASIPDDHTCALLDDHTVKCWGSNAGDYTLGIGAPGDRGDAPGTMGNALPVVNLGTGRTAKAISAASSLFGSKVTCAILDTGAVKCWGTNDHGELGIGDYGPHGDTPADMGDGLPAVDLGVGRTAKSIVVGSGYGTMVTTCALLDDDRVKCWGSNDNGVLGLGDTQSRGAKPGDMGDALPYVDLGH
jgi:alpha-tubulin suppressor-like RCC1 family protein